MPDHHWVGKASIGVPAGRWDDCLKVIEFGGSWHGQDHYFCEGVGFAKHSSMNILNVAGRIDELWDLVDYEIPPVIPVP